MSPLHDGKYQINENTFRLEADFPLCSHRCDHVLLTKQHIFPVYCYILERLFSSLNLESGSLFWLLSSKWKPRHSWVNSSVGSSSWKHCVVRSLAVLKVVCTSGETFTMSHRLDKQFFLSELSWVAFCRCQSMCWTCRCSRLVLVIVRDKFLTIWHASVDKHWA